MAVANERLISADALIASAKNFRFAVRELENPFDAVRHQGKKFLEMVENAPTVDAVEVVRCKDCKYWERLTDGNLCGDCNGHRNGLQVEYTTEDDFCSYGEKRGD